MSKRLLWVEVACLSLACLGLPLRAQAPPASPQQTQLTLRVATRLVLVHVVAQDREGEPVTDLTREDFHLLDDGREQPISVFSIEASTPTVPCSEPLPPNAFSNRFEQCGQNPAGVTVILFDGLNTRLTDQAYAKQQIIKFLEKLQPQDRVALYVMGRGPRVLQDFTNSPDSLRHALASYRPDLSPEVNTAIAEDGDIGMSQLNAWLDELKLNLFDYYARDRALRTVRSLVAIANHVERLPGRKNLVWVSGGFPVWMGRSAVLTPDKLERRQDSFAPEIERAVRALNNANLAIYPVDARGLMAPLDFSPERASISREPLRVDRSTFEIMQVLAERTGGRPFYHNNDLAAALRRAVHDLRVMYVLGYYPTHGKWNGGFREIKVRVKRPGIQLWHRRGYFAQPEEPPQPWYRRAVLDAAMWNPLDASRLGLTVRVGVTRTGLLDLEFQIDPNDITLEQKGDIWEGALDLLLVELGPEERLLKTTSHVANLRLIRPNYERVMQQKALILSERLEIVPAASLLRVLVRDVHSGALGSVTIPLRRVPTERSP